MPRRATHLEVNSFIRGLITEASPLTFPENASLDEKNFILNLDGSRDRRLGVDYESGYVINTAGEAAIPATGIVNFSTFNWKNAGGDPERELVVVQTGGRIAFFNALEDSVSANQVGATFDIGDGSRTYSYAVVDGTLVVATGNADLESFTYDGTTVTKEDSVRIKVRDLWGVAATDGGNDLYSPQYLTTRPNGPSHPDNPQNITDEHLFNLRNQSWGVPRLPKDITVKFGDLSGLFETLSQDPLVAFEDEYSSYPSNADIVHTGVLVSPSDSENPPREKFFPHMMGTQPDTNSEAAKGFFIIDALERSSSRVEAYNTQCTPAILGSDSLQLSTLPTDRTTGGATCVEEFAGRVFYGGFGGELVGGDINSPKLSSYIFFSRLVKHERDIGLCYQEGDPTDKDQPDLVATDGGFIRLQGAYGIKRLVNIGNALVVLAENGAWLIRGDSGIGFSATAYEVVKLTDRGCVSAESVVVVDNSLLYWSSDGIYAVEANEVQDYQAKNITHTTISTFYDDIPEQDKQAVKGFFDSFDRRVSWVYGTNLNSTDPVKLLTLDIRLGAFYPSEIKQPSDGIYPKMVSAIQVPPFRTGASIDAVVVEGDQVQSGAVDVQITTTVRDPSLRELKYLTITGVHSSGQPQYTFSTFKDQEFLDWKTFDSTGVDAEAFLITGYLTGGDSSREKYVPTVHFHFKRTEDAFQVVDGDVVPTKPSSCKVQARWDWSNSANSNRWGREFQAYRYTRHYIPEEITDPFDSGFETIKTRNRLRGNGQALSLKLSTEAGKDLRLLGWGQEVLVEERV